MDESGSKKKQRTLVTKVIIIVAIIGLPVSMDQLWYWESKIAVQGVKGPWHSSIYLASFVHQNRWAPNQALVLSKAKGGLVPIAYPQRLFRYGMEHGNGEKPGFGGPFSSSQKLHEGRGTGQTTLAGSVKQERDCADVDAEKPVMLEQLPAWPEVMVNLIHLPTRNLWGAEDTRRSGVQDRRWFRPWVTARLFDLVLA